VSKESIFGGATQTSLDPAQPISEFENGIALEMMCAFVS